VEPRSFLFERQPLNQGPYHEQIPGWPTAWPIEWQNWSFWQTVFDGPQAHGADAGCSALQDIAGGLGLATCRTFASAKPTDMAIARKLITKVFSMVSSSLDDAGHGFPLIGPETGGRGQKPEGSDHTNYAAGTAP
jgi:hypothetical protein